MKIIVKKSSLSNDRAFKDCTEGTVYDAEYCDNPLVKALLEEGTDLTDEEILEIESAAQCLKFKDDEGDDVWCIVNEVILVEDQ